MKVFPTNSLGSVRIHAKGPGAATPEALHPSRPAPPRVSTTAFKSVGPRVGRARIRSQIRHSWLCDFRQDTQALWASSFLDVTKGLLHFLYQGV